MILKKLFYFNCVFYKMFSIQGWSGFSPGKFILLLCVISPVDPILNKRDCDAVSKVSLHFSSVLPQFFLKKPALRGLTF